MIEYKYNKKEDIFYVKRYGEVSFDNMIEYINNISKQSLNHKSLYLLTDTRESITKFNIEDFPFILNEIKKRLHNYEEVKDAIIVEAPLNAAFSMFFENISKELENYHYKAFSTVAAAKKWLKII